jgi:Zn-dependent protease with chaperone function
MNNKLDALERGILSDDSSQNINTLTSRSLTDRHPVIYFSLLSVIALIGYVFLISFPLISTYLIITIPQQIIQASNYIDAIIILAEIAIASLSAWISIYLYKLSIKLPGGRPVTNDEEPQLVHLIEKIQSQHNAPAIHRIRITEKFNIRIIRTPKNGYPFAFTNTLLIGLPLMQSLSPEELNTAIVREISHIKNIYRRTSGWFFFLRQTWCQYRIAHQEKWNPQNIIMRVFFAWYSPLFKMLSQNAARIEELHADSYTQKYIDKVTLFEMIATAGISEYYLNNNFWPHLYNKAYKHKTPPYLPYASIETNLHTKLDSETAETWLEKSINSNDSHTDIPSLRQRMANLDLKRIMMPAPVMESSAHYYLADTLKTITQQMDKVWQMTHQFDWQQKFKIGEQERIQLRQLQSQVESGALSDIKVWEYILLIKKHINENSALLLYIKILRLQPKDARINFDIGRTLLNNLDELGIKTLETSMEQDPTYTVIACQLITKFFVAIGNSKSAQLYRRKALAYQVEAA